MNQRYKEYSLIVYHLLRRDFRIFKETFWGKFIDTCLMLFTSVIIFSYFLPAQGLNAGYGPFVLVGIIAGFGFFDVIGKITTLIIDMEGEKTILHTLSLPLPSWLVFFQIGLSWSLHSLITCALLFPMGKLLLFYQFDLSKINYFKLIPMFLLSNLFFGFFALWLASILKKMSSLQHLFVRFINPMYMFGAFMYPWQTSYALSPIIGYASLVNPLVYVMEGMRAAMLGQAGSLPFWGSFGILSAFMLFFAWHAICRLLKRLDCA